jgi:multidrug efflux pump subunit AcrB
MAQEQEQIGDIMLHDPAVYSIAMAIGGRGGSALNTGRMYVTLKARDQRDATAEQVMARLRPQFDRVEGARVFMQVRQDVRMGGRPSRTQYQFTLQDPEINELNAASPRVLAALKRLPQLADVASDQQLAGSTLTLSINRDQAARYGIEPALIDNTLADAFGQRFVAQYFTQLNSYHVVLEILPALQGDLATLSKIYLKSPLTGSEVPLSTFAAWTTEPIRPLVISHQGQFPATTVSFNLAPGFSLGEATNAVQKAVAALQLPPAMQTRFAGTAQACVLLARHSAFPNHCYATTRAN